MNSTAEDVFSKWRGTLKWLNYTIVFRHANNFVYLSQHIPTVLYYGSKKVISSAKNVGSQIAMRIGSVWKRNQ